MIKSGSRGWGSGNAAADGPAEFVPLDEEIEEEREEADDTKEERNNGSRPKCGRARERCIPVSFLALFFVVIFDGCFTPSSSSSSSSPL